MFTLSIKVNGGHVLASPLLNGLQVKPAEIYAPTCVVNGLSLLMVAGQTYTANIQARDFYSNNLKALLATAVQVWRAEILYENPETNLMTLHVSGTIADKAGAPGVF